MSVSPFALRQVERADDARRAAEQVNDLQGIMDLLDNRADELDAQRDEAEEMLHELDMEPPPQLLWRFGDEPPQLQQVEDVRQQVQVEDERPSPPPEQIEDERPPEPADEPPPPPPPEQFEDDEQFEDELPPLLEQVDQRVDPSPPPVVDQIAAQDPDEGWDRISDAASERAASERSASAADFDAQLSEYGDGGDGHDADSEQEPEDDEEDGVPEPEDAEERRVRVRLSGADCEPEPEDDEEGELYDDDDLLDAEERRKEDAAEAEAERSRLLLAAAQVQGQFPGAAAAARAAAAALIAGDGSTTEEEEEEAPAAEAEEDAPAAEAPVPAAVEAAVPAPPPFATCMRLDAWQEMNKAFFGAEVDTLTLWWVIFSREPAAVEAGQRKRGRKLPDFGAAGKSPKPPKPARKTKNTASASTGEVVELYSGDESVLAPKRLKSRFHAMVDARAAGRVKPPSCGKSPRMPSRVQPPRECAQQAQQVIDLAHSDVDMEEEVPFQPHTGLDDDAPDEIFIRGVHKRKMCRVKRCGEDEEGCNDCSAFRDWIKSAHPPQCEDCPEDEIESCCPACDGEKRDAYMQWLREL